MWRYRLTALKLELRRALQVSAEGFTEGHIAAQLTEPQWLDRVATAIARRPTPATGYPTEQATPHLMASIAAATPQPTSVQNQATPHRTDRISTQGARRVGARDFSTGS